MKPRHINRIYFMTAFIVIIIIILLVVIVKYGTTSENLLEPNSGFEVGNLSNRTETNSNLFLAKKWAANTNAALFDSILITLLITF